MTRQMKLGFYTKGHGRTRKRIPISGRQSSKRHVASRLNLETQELNTGSAKDSGGDKTNMQTQKISFDELPKKTLVLSSEKDKCGSTIHTILNTKEKPISSYDFSAISHYGDTWQDVGPDPEDFPAFVFDDRSQWGHKLQMLDDKALDFLKGRGYKILRVNKEK